MFADMGTTSIADLGGFAFAAVILGSLLLWTIKSNLGCIKEQRDAFMAYISEQRIAFVEALAHRDEIATKTVEELVEIQEKHAALVESIKEHSHQESTIFESIRESLKQIEITLAARNGKRTRRNEQS